MILDLNLFVVSHFQSVRLSDKRRHAIENQEASKDYLPRLCVNFLYDRQKTNNYHLIMMLNDKFRMANTAYFQGTYYELTLFKYSYKSYEKKCNERRRNVYDTLQLEPLVKSFKIENLKDRIELRNIRHGNYLIELIPVMNNSLCEEKTMCLAESSENNRFRCVKCQKLITRLVLHDQVFDERASISLRPEMAHALELSLISAADAELKYTSKQLTAFDCAIESSTFQKNLLFSVRVSMSNKNNASSSTYGEPKEMNKCGQVFSAVAPIEFNLNELRLFCDCLKSPSTQIIVPSYAYIIIIVSVLFILINIIYFIVHSNHGKFLLFLKIFF
mgnify:CR=1 FL=1